MKPVYQFCHSFAKNVARVLLDFQVVNQERCIEEGPALICSNHVSFFDPPLVSLAFQREINFLARHTLYSNPVARWAFPRLNVVPIDQDRAGFTGLKSMVKLLRQGNRVLIFPEGGRSPDGKLQPALGGAGLVVAKTQAPVIPIRLFGAYEALPFGAAMPRLSTATAVVGEPIYFSKAECGDTKESYQAISDRILAAIAALECPPDRIPG